MIPTRGPNSCPCGFDLTYLCDSKEENNGAKKALIALRNALTLNGDREAANTVLTGSLKNS